MRVLLEFAKTTIVGGILFLIPIVFLIVLMEKAIVIAEKVVTPVAGHFPVMPVIGVATVTVVGALLLLLLAFVAGLAAKTRLGQRFVGWIEQVFLSKVPGYMLARTMFVDMAGSLASLGNDQKERSVLVRLDDTWQLGIVVDEFASGDLAVFVPGAPSPLSGALYFLAPDLVRPSGLTVPEAAAMLKGMGVGSAAKLGGQVLAVAREA
ncbi:MAG TPA: DUF502 domain-containing protein [Burkholderiaceae bacterium]